MGKMGVGEQSWAKVARTLVASSPPVGPARPSPRAALSASQEGGSSFRTSPALALSVSTSDPSRAATATDEPRLQAAISKEASRPRPMAGAWTLPTTSHTPQLQKGR